MKTGTIGVGWCLIELVKKNAALGIGKNWGLLLTALLSLSITSWSQERNPTPDKKQIICSDCFNLNIQPVYLAKPVYPASARYVRASGKVTVSITIDSNGNVVEAKATSGHPFLWASAVKAALASKFVKTYVDGKPIGGVGVISYNFAPNDPDSGQGEFVPPIVSRPKKTPSITKKANLPPLCFDCLLPRNAVFVPKPKYPKVARAAGASGEVTVEIVVNKLGNVVYAKAVSGHPLLWAASEQAALRAKFKPAVLSKRPVSVRTRIVYNYVL